MVERIRVFADKGGHGVTSLANMVRVLESLESLINEGKGYFEVYSWSRSAEGTFRCALTTGKIRVGLR